MKKVNIEDISWVERKSPKGRYHKFRRDIAEAMEKPEAGPKLPGPAPFEVEVMRLPPGARNFPLHSHTTEWEFYLIVSGTGEMRTSELTSPLKPGDCIMNPPGEAHQITNTGDTDLVYYCIANNAGADIWHYPDSGKWGGNVFGQFFRMTKADYYDGEE